MMINHGRLILFLAAVFLFISAAVQARPRATVKQQTIRAENPDKGHERLVLPYAFSTETLGIVIGVGGFAKGYFQEQIFFGGSVFGGPDEVYGAVLGAWDYQLPWTDRLYATAVGSYGHYPDQRAYVRLAYPPDEPRRGSNDSDEDDFGEAGGDNNWFDFKLEFVLPLGAAREQGMMTYQLTGGMLQGPGTGGKTWNPLKGGVTTLMLRQFNHLESFKTEFGELERVIHPFELGIAYNNTDFPSNPSTGSSQYLSVKRDYGWGEAEFPWTFIEFEASKYFSLGTSDWAKQRVLAFNGWTGDSPTWRETVDEDGNTVITHRPPQYDGAHLGGFYRMRAYPSHRFNDKSVVYATAEYRYTPYWNPIGQISWLRWLKMDWWQFVGFVEGGRVANTYSADELFSDWKADAGLGLRAMMAGGVFRLDWAISEEGSGMWVMFGHPF